MNTRFLTALVLTMAAAVAGCNKASQTVDLGNYHIEGDGVYVDQSVVVDVNAGTAKEVLYYISAPDEKHPIKAQVHFTAPTVVITGGLASAIGWMPFITTPHTTTHSDGTELTVYIMEAEHLDRVFVWHTDDGKYVRIRKRDASGNATGPEVALGSYSVVDLPHNASDKEVAAIKPSTLAAAISGNAFPRIKEQLDEMEAKFAKAKFPLNVRAVAKAVKLTPAMAAEAKVTDRKPVDDNVPPPAAKPD